MFSIFKDVDVENPEPLRTISNGELVLGLDDDYGSPFQVLKTVKSWQCLRFIAL